MSQHSRSMGVAIRKAIVDSYSGGNSEGFEAAQRALWEIGDTIADIHGRRKAAEAIYRIADKILAGDHATILTLPEALQPETKLPGAGKLSIIERVRAFIATNALLSVYVAFCVGLLVGRAA